jgi:FemAB-related protein (PEP-CTERM system-associated)
MKKIADMIDIVPNPDKKQWDQYAAENVAAKYSHLFDWGEMLASTYGLPIVRLAAIDRQTGEMTGILPLILFAPPGKSKRLISLPYTDAAGILADDWQSADRLLLAAMELASEYEADHVELRQDGALQTFFQQQMATGTWCHTPYNFKTGLLRPLPAAVDALWLELSAKVRNQIRKARRCGCVRKVGGADLLADFFAVFSENMRDLGSPVHARELFRSLLDSESLRTGIIVIYLQAKPAAAAFVLRQNATVFNPWASSLRRYRPSCPNMLLYWSMLEYAVQKHCRWFDFGRSTPNAPACRFKVQWGAGMELLVWHVFSGMGQCWDPRSESLSYEDWKSMELERSRRNGPVVRRWISL